MSSHHFLLQASMLLDVDECGHESARHRNPSLLSQPWARRVFAMHLTESLEAFEDEAPDDSDVNIAWCRLVDSFKYAEECLPQLETQRRRKPWISNDTLELISARSQARLTGVVAREREGAKQIRASVARDRA